MSTQAAAYPVSLNPEEMRQATSCLDRARTSIVDAVAGLSDAQWHFQPAPGRWSIAEVLEHVVIVQERVTGPVWASLAAAPPAPDRDAKEVEALIIAEVTKRTPGFQAPDPVRPTGQWTPAVSLERFLANDQAMRRNLESTPELRQHALPSMPLKAISKGQHEVMDGYEWTLLAAGHAERHAMQIVEIKATPGFPAE